MQNTSSKIDSKLFADLVPKALGILMKRTGDLVTSEDALQEALITATVEWPEKGLPANPVGWLITVATRRLVDAIRSDSARRRRETEWADSVPAGTQGSIDNELSDSGDNTLLLLFMCCHSSLSDSSAIALTLRAVGGLTTAEIARAFLVPEATMAQRISRAKQTIKDSGLSFRINEVTEHATRLPTVLHILYLVFNEGYSSFDGNRQSTDLAMEAIRLCRLLLESLPSQPEAEGLLALMLLTHARLGARINSNGTLIPLDEQDRSLWNQDLISEGISLLTTALGRGSVGPYQLQAAIAAIHDEAKVSGETDWPQILALYDLLLYMTESPIVQLNRAVAIAMVHGAQFGLEALNRLNADPRISGHYRMHAVRAHLYEKLGELNKAISGYQQAAGQATSIPERDYLTLKAAQLNHTNIRI